MQGCNVGRDLCPWSLCFAVTLLAVTRGVATLALCSSRSIFSDACCVCRQGSKTTVTEHDLVCVVKFDDDLPNGPFVEGSAGNMFQPGSFSATVPTTGAAWSLVARLVADKHQAELDRFCEGGKMKSYGGGHMVGHVTTCEAVGVLYKGGRVWSAPQSNPSSQYSVVPADGTDGCAMEGSCTVQLRTTDVKKQRLDCCVLL